MSTTPVNQACQGSQLNGERCESNDNPDEPTNLCTVKGKQYWLCTGCSDAWCTDGSCSDADDT